MIEDVFAISFANVQKAILDIIKIACFSNRVVSLDPFCQALWEIVNDSGN